MSRYAGAFSECKEKTLMTPDLTAGSDITGHLTAGSDITGHLTTTAG